MSHTNVGTVLYGYCNGYFGRDSYGSKRIEAEGVDWIVARELSETAKPDFAIFDNPKEKQSCIERWSACRE